MTVAKPHRAFRVTGDHALGAAGIGLATASAAFGIGMALHGPVASLGTGKDFTVFAQLAPHRGDGDGDERRGAVGRGRAGEIAGDAKGAIEGAVDDLDMTATASIPKVGAVAPAAGDAAIIPAVTLEALGTDSATVAIAGRTRIVRIGDDVPGAGQVIAILPGERPALKTSRGLIVPAAE